MSVFVILVLVRKGCILELIVLVLQLQLLSKNII